MALPTPEDLGEDRLPIVRAVAKHCLLPHPEVVAAFQGAVFPSIRNARKRGQTDIVGGREVLYDDNTTPRWALLWAHGYTMMGHPRGWTFAHVWPTSGDAAAYTHLANLCMLPEFFGSLTDKDGPMCSFLRFHAWQEYGWCPTSSPPSEPEGFASIDWRYLESAPNPRASVLDRLNRSKERRAVSLRGLLLSQQE